jgi:Pyruvate/2-oxoacid:ferredoxin oxidoreductase gamma subunit
MSPKTSPYNIIVSGLGGQGVVSLTNTLWKLCELQGWPCQGSVFKGGAQQHGSVVAFLRIFSDHNPDYFRYSPQVPDGELDLIFGLEPWETLRQSRYFGPRTNIVMNTRMAPLLVERYQGRSRLDPVSEIRRLGCPSLCEDFTERAVARFGDAKMTNYTLANEGIAAKLVDFEGEHFLRAYLDGRRARWDITGEPIQEKHSTGNPLVPRAELNAHSAHGIAKLETDKRDSAGSAET